MAVDPIEKKPLRHFYPGRPILSVGGIGCNMSCAYCQNHRISQDAPPAEYVPPEKLLEFALKIPDNLGVAFTYNEPLVGMEYLLDAAPLLREHGMKTVLVTNGYVNEQPLLRLLPHIDAMNIDVKGFSEAWYHRLGGDLTTVKRTAELCVPRCHVEVTSLIVPGENDGEGDMEQLTSWLASLSPDIPLHLSRFFPRHRMTGKPPTPAETLHRLSEVARKHLRHVYIGNV
jgi:pyruvate formate lyase activating enzyme